MTNNIVDIINELHATNEYTIIQHPVDNDKGDIRFINAKEYSRNLVYAPQDIAAEVQAVYGDLAIRYLDKHFEELATILPRLTKTIGFLNEELVIGVIDEYQITTHIAVPILPLVRDLYPEIGDVIDQKTHHPVLSRHVATLREWLVLSIAQHGKQQEFDCRLDTRIKGSFMSTYPWELPEISAEEHLVLNLVFGLEEVLQNDY